MGRYLPVFRKGNNVLYDIFHERAMVVYEVQNMCKIPLGLANRENLTNGEYAVHQAAYLVNPVRLSCPFKMIFET